MRIGTLAQRAGVSTRALRYYEEQGLIRSDRTSGGQRIYLDSTVERVRFVQLLFAAGLSSRKIVDILPCLNTGMIDTRQLGMLREEAHRLDEQAERIRETRTHLENVIASARVVDDVPSSPNP